MKKIATLFALCLAFACGGEAYDVVGDDGAEGADGLGTVEQELSVNSSKYGIVNGTSTHFTCRSDGPSGQDCLVPSSKSIQYCYSNAGGAWTSAEITTLESYGVNQIAGDYPSFTFGRVGDSSSISQTNCANNGTANRIQKGTCSGGSTGSNIENFVCYVPTISGGTLTESLPGQWRKMLGGVITLDLTDIATQGSNANCVKGHGISHWLAAAAGFGHDSSVNDSFGQLHTSRSVADKFVDFPVNFCGYSQASAQEQCFALSVDLGGGGGGGFMSFNSAQCPQ